MKHLFAFAFLFASVVLVAQPKKAPKMAPTTSPGYYVNPKGDTIKGAIRNNPDDPTEFYSVFSFQPAKGGKLMPVSIKKAKAYGFDNKHFVQVMEAGTEIYVEVLARGRLNFYEYLYNGKIDGLPAIEAAYFIQDNMGEGEFAPLRELKKINNKFYKKELKPYMRDQPVIWADLDKFTFNKETVANAIKEFNKFYEITGSN
jgi:hypothetical protein